MNLKRIALVFLLGFAALLLAGCSRTVIGGYSDSPDTKYRVYGRIYGAFGHSFMDETDKKISISIVAAGGTEKLLFKREYRVHGSDVGWDGTWHDGTNLVIEIFEYPPGVNPWDLSKKGTPTNHIRTLTYFFDSKAGKFAEQPLK